MTAVAKLPPLRHSALKRMGTCPARFAGEEEKESQAFEKGTGAHSVLLGGKRLVVWDKKSDKGNQCPRRGADFDAFEALNADSLILLPDEYVQVQGMAEAVRANADAMRVLNGVREKTLLWEIAGRQCRGTPDVDGGHFVTELKSTKSSDPRKFWKDSYSFCYHGALAWYMDGIAMQWPQRRVIPEEAYIVAVEATRPHVVTVFQVPQRAIDAGRAQNRAWFDRLLACEKAGKFPGYATGIVELGFPEDERKPWAAQIAEDEAA